MTWFVGIGEGIEGGPRPPHVTCDICGVRRSALTRYGLLTQWAMENVAPKGWRKGFEGGVRKDYCPVHEQPGNGTQARGEEMEMKSIGVLALEIGLQELADGVKEEPLGSNTGPRIREYLAGCQRDGRSVGITAGPWCAAFACWCGSQAWRQQAYLFMPQFVPHHWRAAVWELVEDARAFGAEDARPLGCWHDVSSGYTPHLGDLAVMRRGTHDPRSRGEEGHVGRIARMPDGAGLYLSLEGNHENRVALVERSILFDSDLCGWIEYPQPPGLTDELRRQNDAQVAVTLDRLAMGLFQ